MTAQQLKNSILQMAVQGKLVPQDPNDEPASVLLERIRAEKEQLIKEKKIKKEKTPSIIFRGADNLPYEKIGKNDPVCIADEIPFDIPDSWEWVRLSTVNEIYTGNSINENEKKRNFTGLSEGYFYISTKDVNFDHSIEYHNGVRIPFGLDKFRVAPQNSILLCIEGGSAGRKISFTNQDVCFGNKLCCFVSLGISYKFLYYYLQAPFFQSAFKKNTSGIIGGVSVNTLKGMFFPVPPLAEQYRIVSEIAKLEPFINSYKKAEEDLAKLDMAFPERLKKSILQEAVQGKLMPQTPADEPAEALLERIRAEKQRLVKEGKIKKDKHESIIYRRDNSYYEKCDSEEVCIDDQLPFEIPENWRWVKLSDLVQFIGGYAYKSGSFIEKSEYQVLRLGNIKNDEIRYSTKPVFISKELAEKTADFQCKKYDILLTMTGTRLKRDYFYTVLVREKDTNCFINQRVGCLRCYFTGLCRWLIWTLKSEGILSQVFQYETGTANQGNLGAENIMKTFIPLPPLEEQERICNLIDRILMQINTL